MLGAKFYDSGLKVNHLGPSTVLCPRATWLDEVYLQRVACHVSCRPRPHATASTRRTMVSSNSKLEGDAAIRSVFAVAYRSTGSISLLLLRTPFAVLFSSVLAKLPAAIIISILLHSIDLLSVLHGCPQHQATEH